MPFIENKQDLALPQGSLILVTGASGYIASNIIKEALDAGYRVRGTARSQEKVDKTKKIHNNSNYEGAIVEDMQHPEAFHEAVKGVDAIIHTANVMSFSSDPQQVVSPCVRGAVSVMQAAAKEPTVKRFVYTSSSTAATNPKPGKKFKIDKNLWNDEVDKYGDMEGELGDEHSFDVYAVSKLRSERAVWNFVKENKPSFVVNCVLPNGNTGRIIDSAGATGDWVIQTYKGNPPRAVPPQYMIDVVDNARVHLIAAIDKTLADERIFTFDTAFNWNDIIDAIHQVRPDAKLPEKDPNEQRDLSEVDNVLGAQLLKKWYGQDGWKGLVQSVRENLEGVE